MTFRTQSAVVLAISTPCDQSYPTYPGKGARIPTIHLDTMAPSICAQSHRMTILRLTFDLVKGRRAPTLTTYKAAEDKTSH